MFGLFKTALTTKEDLTRLIRVAADKRIIDFETTIILESTLQISKLQVKDIMLPRQQMDVIDVNDSINAVIKKIIDTGHSRFPVINGAVSEIVGILHAKDLLGHYLEPKAHFSIKEHLRPAYFVPEVKRLDALLYEMRLRRVHLAMVVDEFTNIAGLVTLEMVVEQIIGEIADEYDAIENETDIVEIKPNVYRINGYTKLDILNAKLGVNWTDEVLETVGGFIIKYLGHLPNDGENIVMGNVTVHIIAADSRRIKLFTLEKSA